MKEGRLDTGMKGSEAVARAEVWWDDVGRGLVDKEFNRQTEPKVRPSKGAGPAVILRKREMVTGPSASAALSRRCGCWGFSLRPTGHCQTERGHEYR